jgi:ATP/maltotriose-dependent transcriptional regulator MalT
VRGAARVAVQLAVHHDVYRGETAIANGWFERARSLLEPLEPAPEHAWLAFWKAHVEIHVRGQVARGQSNLAEAVRLAEAAQPSGELGLLTLGLRGLLAISEGAIDEGLRRLDEVTTAVSAGELQAPEMGWTYCYVLDACENVRDIDRAAQWMDRAFTMERELGIQHFLGACREHYVAILTWRGEYAAAEREIETMRGEVAAVAPAFAARCDVRLGEVRRRQGRLDEAAEVLGVVAAQPLAMLSLGALALDRGDPALGAELAERYLRRVPESDRVRRLHGLDLLARAEVALGRLDLARAALSQCAEFVRQSGTPLMRTALRELEGLLETAGSDYDAARRSFEDAVDGYDMSLAPYEAAAARVHLGRALIALGRDAHARSTLDAAAATADRIGAIRIAESARSTWNQASAPGVDDQSNRSATRHAAGLTARELEVLALVAAGISNQDIGERLFISAFTVKRHIANILTKLDLPNRAAAAAYAIREGLLR